MIGNDFEYNGVKYDSMKSCCSSFGLNFGTVRSYCRTYGISFKTALDMYISGEVKKRHKDSVTKKIGTQSFEFRGIKYKSKTECCRVFGVRIQDVYFVARRHNVTFGIALSKILTGELESGESYKGNNSFEYKGIVYSSRYSCCKEHGVKYGCVKHYADLHNIDFSRALDAYIIYGAGLSLEYDNVSYNSRKDCYDRYGLKSSNVSNVLFRYGVSLTDAIDYCRICNGFSVMSGLGDEFFRNSLFTCRCNSCGGEFVFTKDLAFKHIEEHKGVDYAGF